jgi:acetyltransferase-like isoleucine patch superfamily enzyme
MLALIQSHLKMITVYRSGDVYNERVSISAAERFQVILVREDGVWFGHWSRSHAWSTPLRECISPLRRCIIGEHVWIGEYVTVLKGVTIGSGSMIAIRSLVTRDIPTNCIAGGVPARVLRENATWRWERT